MRPCCHTAVAVLRMHGLIRRRSDQTCGTPSLYRASAGVWPRASRTVLTAFICCTTLASSSACLRGGSCRPAPGGLGLARLEPRDIPLVVDRIGDARSEEHTSELQSPCNLVCRLLLEKKKVSVTT